MAAWLPLPGSSVPPAAGLARTPAPWVEPGVAEPAEGGGLGRPWQPLLGFGVKGESGAFGLREHNLPSGRGAMPRAALLPGCTLIHGCSHLQKLPPVSLYGLHSQLETGHSQGPDGRMLGPGHRGQGHPDFLWAWGGEGGSCVCRDGTRQVGVATPGNSQQALGSDHVPPRARGSWPQWSQAFCEWDAPWTLGVPWACAGAGS